MELKKGDLVTIRDFSYSSRVDKDGVMTHRGNCEPNCRQHFKVVVTNCQIPTYTLFHGCDRVADTVVIGQEDKIVWFVHSALVSLVKHKITIDGKTIEISHESYESLKKQLT